MVPSATREWMPRSHQKPASGKGCFPPSEPSDLGGRHYNPGSSAHGPAAAGMKGEMEASRTTTSSRDEASVSYSNASEVETEWIEEDEPGVYITIRQLVDGTRELRRVRFR